MSGHAAGRAAVRRRLVALLISIACAAPALAAELRVFCPSGLRGPALEAARAFVRSSGHRIEFVFADVGAIHKRVASGAAADVAIGTTPGIDALVRLGSALEGSDAPVARTVLALALPVRERAPQAPDADALTRVLRAADSLVYPDAALGASGGAQVAELVERLGLTAELEPKSRRVADAREVARRVAAGTAQAGIAHMNDIVGTPGAIAVGPLDDPPTSAIEYAAAVVRRSAHPQAAQAFVRFLAGGEANDAFRSAGYAPPGRGR